uniref:Cadherin-1 n=1 Tax=Nothobranchius kuhntae TaxID=321403 RepID=A0A1A8HUK7_NOTKU
MATARVAVCCLLFVFQASGLLAAEESTCVPGFKSDFLIFKVSRKHLNRGTRLGKVDFSDCTLRTRFLFTTDDNRFVVHSDGTLAVKRPVLLHEGQWDFFVHSWDSQGKKMTVPVQLLRQGHHHGNMQNVEHHHGAQNQNCTEEGSEANPEGSEANPESTADPQVPILTFPKSSKGLGRIKRGWVIPPINVPENYRGKFPQQLVQIRSDLDKTKKIYYSVAGPGATEPPINLFTMDRDTGFLYATQALDREKQANYVLVAHANVAGGTGTAEDPMEIIVNVIDQNDNKPIFTQSTYTASVAEASPINFDIVQVEATDADDPNTDNADIRYRITSQVPEVPYVDMFTINPTTGAIRVNRPNLDREKYPQYTLMVRAADTQGEGLFTEAKVILKVTDSNDLPPVFTQSSYKSSVEENKVDAVVVRMSVTDGDDPHTQAWNAKFTIVDGDAGGFFAVKTGANKQEGILYTVKGLDYEMTSIYTLMVSVENEVPFVNDVPTSTATVTVTVLDINEPPIFDPTEKHVAKPESLLPGSGVTVYTASDPDTARKQTVMYRMLSDPAGWLEVKKETGEITVRNLMDRESPYVKADKYTALIGAYDDDALPATGTGTLVITLQDVNDNAPAILERDVTVCNKNPVSQLLTVVDEDGPGFTSPFSVSVHENSQSNWTARMNSTKTGIILDLKPGVASGTYSVLLKVADIEGLPQVCTLTAKVCDCTGDNLECLDRVIGGTSLPVILGILGGILALLLLVLLLLAFTNRKRPQKGTPLLQDDDLRDNIFYYDEEGGGEDDQDYDLSVLHRGLDNRPEVFRNDVAPAFLPAPQYRPRPTNPDEIGTFIDDNLKAADNDPTAPPYDSLLVFDYEGVGSEAGSLSSLNSSSSGDEDYDRLNDWGPRFKKLADMYGGGEDDDML